MKPTHNNKCRASHSKRRAWRLCHLGRRCQQLNFKAFSIAPPATAETVSFVPQGKKKGADGGIDGLKFFRDLDKKGDRKIIVSVKGGENVGPAMVKDLIATIARDKAEIGLFLTFTEPTKVMSTEAVAAGFCESASGKKYPRLQILTTESLLADTARPEHPDYEPDLNFKKAKADASGEQAELL